MATNSNMDHRIQEAIKTNNVVQLHDFFSSSWLSLGQGEQKSLSACFIRAVLSSHDFLSVALNRDDDSSYHSSIRMFKNVLSNLPPSVENAGDNKLREMLSEHLLELEEYGEAAIILSGYRFEDDEFSPYYSTPDIKTDIYVKVAECFLHEDDIVEADAFVTKAGASAQALSMMNMDDPNGLSTQHLTIILRYKSTYARILDANRKFLSAASRYYDLSVQGSLTDIIDGDDLLEFFGRAITCAILAPSCSQRQRMLGTLYKDERLPQLESNSQYATHSSILSKMYMEQIIRRDRELVIFENALADHQKAIMSDGLTIFQRALMEHNIVAASRIYSNIYLSSLAELLSISLEKTEKAASKMILEGFLMASIDQVDGILYFEKYGEKYGESLVEWDGAIEGFCLQLNAVVDSIRQH